MKWLDKLDRKFGRYYIHNLMAIITAGSAAVYLISEFMQINIVSWISLNPYLVMQGQVWRLITFIFVPPSASMIFIVFVLYFYYMAGSALEYNWGSFKFNIYYLIGMISTIIICFATGSVAGGSIISLSLFLAYAKLYPEAEMLIFFVIPVKIKYLGYLTWAIIVLGIVQSALALSIGGVLLNLVPVINYLIFFGKSNYRSSKMRTGSVIRMSDYKRSIKSVQKEYTHKCTVCGITDINDPDMTFRYCSKCHGKYAYCEKHIRDHEHKE